MPTETSTPSPDSTAAPAVKQLLCIKWGTAYGARDVNILHAMIARNITGPFRLYCFTDNAEGIRGEVTCLPLPELGCKIPPDVPGKWPKSALWGKELFGLGGPALFIDLDSVIVGNIDGYFTYGSPDDVITARNWVKPWRKLGQTSVFRYTIGRHAYMLENLRADPEGISRKYRYEQHYVTAGIKGGIKFWPAAWTRHFRLHCLGNWLVRLLRAPVLPPGAKIITFAGGDKALESAQGRCCGKPGGGSAWSHVRWALSGGGGNGRGFVKNLKNYMRPAAWIAQHWRE